MLSHLATSLRISRRVAVAVCDRVASPVLIGIVRPMILLPPAALTGWSPDEIEMVLLHELAHVRRWDNLVNLLQRCLESLLFFHPAVWLISAWVRSEREACCDATVVARTNRPHAYAELLVALAAQLPRSVLFHPAASSAMSAGPLRSRIRQILKMEDDPMLISGKSLACALGAIALTATLATIYAPRIGQAEEAKTASKDASEEVAGSNENTTSKATVATATDFAKPLLLPTDAELTELQKLFMDASGGMKKAHYTVNAPSSAEPFPEYLPLIKKCGRENVQLRCSLNAIRQGTHWEIDVECSPAAQQQYFEKRVAELKKQPASDIGRAEQATIEPAEQTEEGKTKTLADQPEGGKSPPSSEFHYVVSFEKGASKFLDGDDVTITEIRGTAKEFEPGNNYQIKGRYKLHSHAAAQLNAYTTAQEAKDGTSSGPDQKTQSQKVSQGEGDFTLILPMTVHGWPHLSFYPIDGGEDFGGVYFGTRDTVLRQWWGEKSGEKDEPAKLPSKSEFKYEVKFEKGVSKFLDGDDITIDEIRGNAKVIEPGNNYWIRGKYKLHSHPDAQLSAFTTAKEAKDGTGPIQSVQTQKISRGEAEFTIILPMTVQGWPHLSFYATDSGDGFGGIYFGTGENVLKKSWAFGKLNEDEKEVERTRFEHFEDSLKTTDFVIAVFNDKAGYSRQLDPVFKALVKDHHSLDLWGLNVDPKSSGPARYHLSDSPACIVFRSGVEIARLDPIKDAEQLAQFVERAAASPTTIDLTAKPADSAEPVGEALATYPANWQAEAKGAETVLNDIKAARRKHLYVDLVQKDDQWLLVVARRPTEKDWPAILGAPPRKDRVIAEKTWHRLGVKIVPLNWAEKLYDEFEGVSTGVKIIGGNVPKGLPIPSVLTSVSNNKIDNMDSLLQWLDGDDGRAQSKVRCFATADDNEFMFDAQPAADSGGDSRGKTTTVNPGPATALAVASPYSAPAAASTRTTLVAPQTDTYAAPSASSLSAPAQVPALAPGAKASETWKTLAESAKRFDEAAQRKIEAMEKRLAAKTDKETEESQRNLDAANKHLEEAKQKFKAAQDAEINHKPPQDIDAPRVQSSSGTTQSAAGWSTGDRYWTGADWAAPGRTSTSASPEEIEILRDRVKEFQDQLTYTTERMKAGKGATNLDVERATSDLSVAQSELAIAEGHRDDAIKNLNDAREHAEVAVKIQTASAHAGIESPDLDAVMKANRNLSEIKLKLIRLQHEEQVTKAIDSSNSTPTPSGPKEQQTYINERSSNDVSRSSDLVTKSKDALNSTASPTAAPAAAAVTSAAPAASAQPQSQDAKPTSAESSRQTKSAEDASRSTTERSRTNRSSSRASSPPSTSASDAPLEVRILVAYDIPPKLVDDVKTMRDVEVINGAFEDDRRYVLQATAERQQRFQQLLDATPKWRNPEAVKLRAGDTFVKTEKEGQEYLEWKASGLTFTSDERPNTYTFRSLRGHDKVVVVSKVIPGSPADWNGIEPGDVLMLVDRFYTTSLAELESVLKTQGHDYSTKTVQCQFFRPSPQGARSFQAQLALARPESQSRPAAPSSTAKTAQPAVATAPQS
ncbi:MAG TPA: M56 family metallopeptidase, partial [Lacipirellulaceae bacterium]|nr:M56 family metallopeptidase [Lacipirellulaceae bacterium]